MLFNKQYFIDKFEALPESAWQTRNYHNPETGASCALGHCGARIHSPDPTMPYYRDNLYTAESEALVNLVPYIVKINDGVGVYPGQTTPKARVLAALRDLP